MKTIRAFFFSLLAAGLFSPVSSPVVAQDDGLRGPPTLTVRGEGVSEVKPDFARVSVFVSTRGRTLADAAKQHEDLATQAHALLLGLKGDGVSIDHADFTLEQDRPPPVEPRAPKPPAPPPSFIAQTQFHLSIRPVDRLDSDLSKLAGSGLLNVGSVDFGVDHPHAALDQARRAAMIDAKRQADVYADAGGFRLAGIETVSGAQAFPLAAQALSMRAEGASGSMQIVPPARLTFRSEVTVAWRIAPR